MHQKPRINTGELIDFINAQAGTKRIANIPDTIWPRIGQFLADTRLRLFLTGLYFWIKTIRTNLKALAWAESGLQAFPKAPHWRLLAFLVSQYLKIGQPERALQIVWLQYDEQPRLETYRKLHEIAAGAGCLESWRTRALERIATMPEPMGWNRSEYLGSGADLSQRLAIASWEKDIAAVLETIQRPGSLTRKDALAAASLLENEYPDHAIDLYQKAVRSLVNETKNQSYAESMPLIRHIRRLMLTQNQAPRFMSYTAELTAAYKAKRNFTKLLTALINSRE